MKTGDTVARKSRADPPPGPILAQYCDIDVNFNRSTSIKTLRIKEKKGPGGPKGWKKGVDPIATQKSQMRGQRHNMVCEAPSQRHSLDEPSGPQTADSPENAKTMETEPSAAIDASRETMAAGLQSETQHKEGISEVTPNTCPPPTSQTS